MLKLKLLWALISKHTKTTLISLIALIVIFFVVRAFLDLRSEVQASHRREHNFKMLLVKSQKGFRAVAEVNKNLEGVYLLEKKISAHWKAIALSGSGTQTELDSNRTKVEFDTTTACISIEGFTLTNPPYYELGIEKQPFSISIFVTDFDKNIYSWTSTVDSLCAGIDSVYLEVSPDLKGAYRDGFDTGEFILGGVIALGGVLAYAVLR